MEHQEKELLEKILHELREIRRELRPHHAPEPTSFKFVQIKGDNMPQPALTNNTIQQGTTGRFLIVPNAGSAFQNAPVPNVDAASAALGIQASLESAVDPTTGEFVADVAVPQTVPVGTQITLGGTDQTAAGVVTGTPTVVTVVAPILPEPTAFTFKQIA
jgi:hypothetical protein